MADLLIGIPSIFDYLGVVVTSVSFWGAIVCMSMITIAFSRIYRRRRGWY